MARCRPWPMASWKGSGWDSAVMTAVPRFLRTEWPGVGQRRRGRPEGKVRPPGRLRPLVVAGREMGVGGLVPAGNSLAIRNRGLGVVPGWLLSTAAGGAEGSDAAARGDWSEGRDGGVPSAGRRWWMRLTARLARRIAESRAVAWSICLRRVG